MPLKKSPSQPSQPFLMTIDGPSASGKSSVGRKLAQNLHWKFLSTGLFYRGMAWLVLEKKVNPQREKDVLDLLQSEQGNWQVSISSRDTSFHYRDRDLTEALSQDEVGALSSWLAKYSSVRQLLLHPQRECYEKLSFESPGEKGFIAEGRDCGTVIFPEAHLKVYLTAKEEIRAKRRASEWGHSPKEVRKSQRKRDERDRQRQDAPLKKAEGAWVIDSSEMDLDSVVDMIEKKIHSLHLVSK